MKKILPFALLLLFFTSFGCSDNDDSTPAVIVNTDIVGQWTWIESTGGITGTTLTPESTGNTITLTISDTTVKRFVNGTQTWEYPYTIEVQSSIFGGESPMLIFPQDVSIKQSFYVTDGILHLNDECADCYNSTYESI